MANAAVVPAPAPGGRVAAWGDWGWAIQTSPTQVTLLNQHAEFRDQEAGVVYDSRPDGWLFVVGDRPKLVSAGGGVLALDADLGIGRLAAAAFSPDRTRVAVVGERGVNILDLESGAVDQLGGGPTAQATWSTDSRFVIAPGGSGVVVHDVHTASSYQVLEGNSIMAVEVVTPEEYMGSVNGDLNRRRGQIEKMEPRPGNVSVVTAFVPLSEMFGYTTDLRSATQGRATSSMHFERYAEAPRNVAEEIIAKVKGASN